MTIKITGLSDRTKYYGVKVGDEYDVIEYDKDCSIGLIYRIKQKPDLWVHKDNATLI